MTSKNEPAATLSFYSIERDDSGKITDAMPEINVSIFHKLTSGILELDDLCHEFNAMPCNDWNGSYYGISGEQYAWLTGKGFQPINQKYEGWNTYNWDNNFSQVLQGTDLELNGGSLCIDGGNYVLLQIHGGADVRVVILMPSYSDLMIIASITPLFLITVALVQKTQPLNQKHLISLQVRQETILCLQIGMVNGSIMTAAVLLMMILF